MVVVAIAGGSGAVVWNISTIPLSGSQKSNITYQGLAIAEELIAQGKHQAIILLRKVQHLKHFVVFPFLLVLEAYHKP